MKRLFLSFLCLGLFLLLGFQLFRAPPKGSLLPEAGSTSNPPSSETMPTSKTTVTETIAYNGISYAYAFFTVKTFQNLELISNFKEKETTSQLVATHHCLSGINGGFYDKEGNPLGGFTTAGKLMKSPIKSRLMDGSISFTNTRAMIGLSPLPDASTSLQTGPLLVLDGKPTTLTLTTDEHARRSVAILTSDGQLVFLVLYDPDSVYMGPNLADMPQIIMRLNEKFPSSAVSAINLDGGNASAFTNAKITLSELAPVGSFFCFKKDGS